MVEIIEIRETQEIQEIEKMIEITTGMIGTEMAQENARMNGTARHHGKGQAETAQMGKKICH